MVARTNAGRLRGQEIKRKRKRKKGDEERRGSYHGEALTI